MVREIRPCTPGNPSWLAPIEFDQVDITVSLPTRDQSLPVMQAHLDKQAEECRTQYHETMERLDQDRADLLAIAYTGPTDEEIDAALDEALRSEGLA